MTTTPRPETTETARIRTWKIETTATGVVLVINGVRYATDTATAHSIAFDLDRAALGLNGSYGAEVA